MLLFLERPPLTPRPNRKQLMVQPGTVIFFFFLLFRGILHVPASAFTHAVTLTQSLLGNVFSSTFQEDIQTDKTVISLVTDSNDSSQSHQTRG